MNTGASWPSLEEAAVRVLGMQAKLHRWAGENEDRRFDDLYNLVYDPAFLAVAWSRVKGITVPARPAWTARPSATSRPGGERRRSLQTCARS